MAKEDSLTPPDRERMAGFLQDCPSNRKLRLFACALSRHALTVFASTAQAKEVCLGVVSAAERFADGLATSRELANATAGLYRIRRYSPPGTDGDTAKWASRWTIRCVAWAAGDAGGLRDVIAGTSGVLLDLAEVPFGEIFGNPFRMVETDRALRVWNNGTIVKLAQAIYEDLALRPPADPRRCPGGCRLPRRGYPGTLPRQRRPCSWLLGNRPSTAEGVSGRRSRPR
jgi:hypothetical protein